MRKPELSIALIQVLRRAAWQARTLGHSYVGTEHFLLSLLTAERAGGVLRSLGWEECTLRSVLLLERGRGSRAVPLVPSLSPICINSRPRFRRFSLRAVSAPLRTRPRRSARRMSGRSICCLRSRARIAVRRRGCCVGRARISTAFFPMSMRSARRLCRPEREGSQVRSCWNYIVRTWSKRRRQWSRSSGANASLGSCCKF